MQNADGLVVVGWSEHTPCSQEFEFSGLLTSAPAGSVFITAYSLLHRRATSTQPVRILNSDPTAANRSQNMTFFS